MYRRTVAYARGADILAVSIGMASFGAGLLAAAWTSACVSRVEDGATFFVFLFGVPGAVLTTLFTLRSLLAIGYCIVERQHWLSSQGTVSDEPASE